MSRLNFPGVLGESRLKDRLTSCLCAGAIRGRIWIVFMAYLDRGIGEAYVSPQIEQSVDGAAKQILPLLAPGLMLSHTIEDPPHLLR